MTVKGLTTPKRIGCVELLFLCRYEGLKRSLLLDWYLGSQKLREILSYFAASSFPLRGNPTQAQEVARRISGAVAGEVRASQDLTPDNEQFLAPLPGGLRKSQHTKYSSQSLSPALHYLPFASRFPLPHFTLAILFALFPLISFCLLLVCLCVRLIACHDGSR